MGILVLRLGQCSVVASGVRRRAALAHGVGDDVLRWISQLLAGLVRPADKVARYGGEEFICLLPEQNENGAVEFAERIRQLIEQAEVELEAQAVRERVNKRMSVLGEQLWGNGEVTWAGEGRLDDVLYKREEAAPEVSIVYGLVEE